MSKIKLAIHGHNYKVTALSGLDKHNRRLNREYGNTNIDITRKADNLILIGLKESLYRDAKQRIEEQVISYGGRVTKASNWICEFIVYAPENLSSEKTKDYFNTIVEYFSKNIGKDNILSAIVHRDETHTHMHLDFTPIINHKLSSKKVMTRNFLLRLHDELPEILSSKGYDVQRGEHVKDEERHLKGRSTRKYKSEIESEKSDLLIQCKTAQFISQELSRNNLEIAKKIILQEKRLNRNHTR